MKVAKGFTLIEVMVTVVVLAIIVSVAIPSYNGYVTRGKITEATAQLSSLRVQMEQQYQDNRTYQGVGGCGVAMPTMKYFTYTCQSPLPTQYTITATGNASANMGGFQYTVDQSNTKQTTQTPAGWGGGAIAPAGQIPPNPVKNCWVVNKGGLC